MDESSRAFQMPLGSRDDKPAREFSFRVAQLSLTDGIWQDQPDHLASFTSERLGPNARGRGALFVLLDVSGETDGRAEIERELVEQIREAFATGRGSVSFGLTEALRAANRYLHELNHGLPREARRMAGVSAVCVRGSDVYIAQAGPALVFLYSRDTLTQYPAHSPWLEEDSPRFGPNSEASIPLGVQLEFASDLTHAAINAGDVLILAMRSLAQLVTNDEVQDAVATKHADEINEYIESLAADTDIAALIVEIEPPPSKIEESESPGSKSQSEGDEARRRGAEKVAPGFPRAEPAPLAVPAAPVESHTEGGRLETPVEETQERKLERLREERRRKREERQAIKLPSLTLPSAAPVRNALASFLNRWSAFNRNLDRSPALRRVGTRTNRALNTAFGALGNLMRQALRFVLPGVPARERLVPQRVSNQPIWMKIIALLLPVVFVALAGGMVYRQTQDLDRRLDSLVTQAKQLVTEADAQPDREAKRGKLDQAESVLREAQKIHDDNRVATLYYQIQDKKNELDGIVVLYSFTAIRNYNDPNAKLARLIVRENDIFVFDRGIQRIYRYTLNDAGTGIKTVSGDGSILKTGDHLGERTVGDLVDMAWADPGGNLQIGKLIAVDTAGTVMTYELGEAKWEAIAVEPRVWSPPTVVGTFSGNLYVVAPQKNQILRFVPTLAGYTQAPTNYFPPGTNVDLTRVVNLAIDADVWLLRDDGKIARYRTGSAATFNMGENTPTNAVALFTSLTTNSVYIADSATQRLLQFDKNGKFQRQLKPPTQDAKAFETVASLFVDELKSKIYFISANTAYMANLPK